MFASQVKKQIIVNDSVLGEITIQIRKLNARSLEKASDARQIAVAKVSKALGREWMDQFKDSAEEEARKKQERKDKKKDQKDIYNTYDRDATLQAGIDLWSLGPEGQMVKPEPLGDKSLEDLDFETAENVFHEIIDLSVPKPKEEQEEISKND